MGAKYTLAQKEASKRYAESTDQIRVRTEKGNLDFIKEHAASMNETMGELVNRAIFETIYKDRGETFVMDVISEDYGIEGKLLTNRNDNYEIAFYTQGRFIIRELEKTTNVPHSFIEDYAWMALEDEYEKVLMGE